MNEVSIIINGVEYEPIDSPSNGQIGNCLDCDIFKARPPQSMMQVPLCCEEEFIGVNESCCEQSEKGIHRIWKKKKVRAMKKKYVFNNLFTKKKGEPYRYIEVEADTILEAKKKVKEMGYDNMCFIRIKILRYG